MCEDKDQLLHGNEHRAMGIMIPEAGEWPGVLNVPLSSCPGNPSCGLLRAVT